MAELGIEVRVWVGWGAEHNLDERLPFDPRLSKGVIEDGPIFLGFDPNPFWRVRFDHGDWCNCGEEYLFPIDDGEDQTTRDEREPVEVEA